MALFGPNVQKIKKKGDIGKLIELLGHDKPDVRNDARIAIEEMRDPRSFDLLVLAFQEGDGRTRDQAAKALANLLDPRTIDVLVAVVRGGSSFTVRVAAVELLGSLGDERTIDALADLVSDWDHSISAHAVTALERFGASAVAVLKERVRGDPAADLGTLRALTELGDKDAVERIVDVVLSPSVDSDVRCEAAIFLRQTNVAKGNRALIERIDTALNEFKSDDASLRFLVYEFGRGVFAEEIATLGSAIARFGDAAIEPLLTALGDHKMLGRYRAVAPMTEEEAGRLILELTRRRIEQMESMLKPRLY